MDAANLSPLLEQLEDNVNDLQHALSPLIKHALSDIAAKLPLLDKAKLYVLVTYAIESILFSLLRLQGVNAKDHPVFRELARVKQYFEKIKTVEASGTKRENMSVDKQAAGRFIKHALAGNAKYDLERAATQEREKVRAHIRFEELATKRKTEAVDEDQTVASNPQADPPSEEVPTSGRDDKGSRPKRRKRQGN